jgi:hypothetical protein
MFEMLTGTAAPDNFKSILTPISYDRDLLWRGIRQRHVSYATTNSKVKRQRNHKGPGQELQTPQQDKGSSIGINSLLQAEQSSIKCAD